MNDIHDIKLEFLRSGPVVDKSRVVWKNLEAWVRAMIQGYVQDLLEEEVTVLLGERIRTLSRD